ncbi:hypothetical protein M3625_08325 [Paenibacillus sp. MER 78]|nr:hypothetical protein [Paenibacillus sp. MER 78]
MSDSDVFFYISLHNLYHIIPLQLVSYSVFQHSYDEAGMGLISVWGRGPFHACGSDPEPTMSSCITGTMRSNKGIGRGSLMRDEIMMNMVRMEELKIQFLGHEPQSSIRNQWFEKPSAAKTQKTRMLLAISSLFRRK